MARAATLSVETDAPEADRLGDFPHPRENPELEGHDTALSVFAEAIGSGRLHHAWLLSGPQGIGKATLAYRVARTLLKYGVGRKPPPRLELASDDPVFRRIASASHGGLLVLRRPWDPNARPAKFKTVLPVDEVRRAAAFFSMSSGEGGWRICIVDSADEMNANAANALLKILEEPPERALFLLVSHSPGRLPATVRSRCRKLRLQPLSDGQVEQTVAALCPELEANERAAVARLGEGSPGKALALAEAGALALYDEMLGLLRSLPRTDIVALHALGDKLARPNNEAAYHTFMGLLTGWLEQMVRTHAAGKVWTDVIPGEAEVANRLVTSAPLEQWVEVWENITLLAAQADAVNLGRKHVLLNIFTSLAETAGGSGRP